MRHHLSYANVMSSIAAFLALGGVAVAGVSLGRNAVKTPNIANNAVTSAKVKDFSLLPRDFNPNAKILRKTIALPSFTTTSSGPTGDEVKIKTTAKLTQRPSTIQWITLEYDLTAPTACAPRPDDDFGSSRVSISVAKGPSSEGLFITSDRDMDEAEPGKTNHETRVVRLDDVPVNQPRSRAIEIGQKDTCNNGQHFQVKNLKLKLVDFG